MAAGPWRDVGREHAKGALPTHVAGVKIPPFSPVSSPPSFVSHLYTGMTSSSRATDDDANAKGGEEKKFAGFGFGRQGEKAAALKGYLISKPVESLPRYVPKSEAL